MIDDIGGDYQRSSFGPEMTRQRIEAVASAWCGYDIDPSRRNLGLMASPMRELAPGQDDGLFPPSALG